MSEEDDLSARLEALRRAAESPDGPALLRSTGETEQGKALLRRAFDTPERRKLLSKCLDSPEWRKLVGEAYVEEIRKKQPPFIEAVWEDGKMYSSLMMGAPRFETRVEFLREVVRLSLASDAFLAMLAYRVRKLLQAHGVPVLPSLLHRTSMALAQVCIGDHVVLQPGVYLPHGQVVIDGGVEIGSGAVIGPWVTIGRAGGALEGPHIDAGVFIGTGAKLLGAIKVGMRANVGANAVVLKDVEPFTSVGGVPAKMIADHRDGPEHEALKAAVRRKAAEKAARRAADPDGKK